MRHWFNIALCALVVLLSSSAYSQGLTASTTLDTNIILIGDQINLLIEVKNSSDYQISFPEIAADTLVEGVEILDRSPIDTLQKKDSDTIIYRQNLVITSFDSGFYALPPFRFILNNDTATYMETEPLLLEVRTVEVDMMKDFKDIKGPLSIPKSWLQLIMYVGIGLFAVIILAFVLIFIIMKKKPSDFKSMVQRKPLPPHEIALAKLQNLKEKKLWQNGMVKEYHSGISEIIREYLEKHFGFNALEQVSEEILAEMKDRVDGELLDKLKKVLELADLAKFAKMQPLPDENEASMTFAIDIVNATKPREITAEKTKQVEPKQAPATEPEKDQEEKPKEE